MSYDPSRDPIKSVARGVTEGLLDWSKEQVRQLISKLRDKELAFIQDKKTIKRVKELYRSGELAIYKEYIKDEKMLFLLKMGLTLRSLEKGNEEERRGKLRTKIFNKYEIKGLHIAQFVENGILNRYIGILMEDIDSVDKFKKDIRNILENIEKHVLFVERIDTERGIIKQTVTMVHSHRPMIFVVSGISSAANIVRNCEGRLKELLVNYELEKISSERKENLFFKRIINVQ
ncbi:MAG: hypothetical protein BME93_01870 [Methanosarcinales archaeon Met12]|nr:MAG: hypothetical protein BME93_01870 [Methanosarcinales archaeon Met12]